MLFSVIVPTHNRLIKLQKLIASLESQSLEKDQFEVLVVPSPNDRSLPWLKNISSSSTLKLRILSPTNDPYQGKSASYKRNIGAQNALADWIAFIDDDCTAHPDWLASTLPFIQNHNIHGIEGHTKIPPPLHMTLTYKGIQRLSTQGGYQTCNIFYRKSTFREVGGFDLNFPFYLEDTDLAWSFLDRNRAIYYSENTIVEHPVPEAESHRLIDNAWRTNKLAYLYKKHPDLFETSEMKPLSRSQWTYLFIYAGVSYSLYVDHSQKNILLMVFIFLLFHFSYIAKLLYGCKFSQKELFELMIYLPVAPLIAFFQLIRGNIENKTFIIFNR